MIHLRPFCRPSHKTQRGNNHLLFMPAQYAAYAILRLIDTRRRRHRYSAAAVMREREQAACQSREQVHAADYRRAAAS